jgi:4-hydroxybenzoate polyprenyltransferase
MHNAANVGRWEGLRLIAADIKLAHSVFAMPFALLAAFMAAKPFEVIAIDWPRFSGQLALIVLAMFLARTCAMLANRILDREIDARNPRTAARAIPSGKLPVPRAVLTFGVCAIGFFLACAGFGVVHGNWWPLILSAPVLAWICAYPYLKRFTALCHLYLGASLALSPIAAAIAIQPESIAPGSPYFQPAILLLSAMVLCWVAGFDIIYALQDVEVDRTENLHSIPARFGVKQALVFAQLLHALALGALAAALLIDDRLQALFGAGVAVVALLLAYEHATVSRWGTTRIALAFFTLNGLISCIVGALGIVDVMM